MNQEKTNYSNPKDPKMMSSTTNTINRFLEYYTILDDFHTDLINVLIKSLQKIVEPRCFWLNFLVFLLPKRGVFR